MKVYLAGPINGCSDAECKDWREQAKQFFGEAAECLDPMARDYRGMEQQNVADIVEGDKRDIDECDVLLVYYVKPSVGTSMEVLYAWERGKKVVVVAPGGVETLSPWLVYHSHAQTASLEIACNGLKLAFD